MNRDYGYINQYLEVLGREVMHEPTTRSHTRLTTTAFNRYVKPNLGTIRKAADVGCGPGEALALLTGSGIDAVGVTMTQKDVETCASKGLRAIIHDQSFLPFESGSLDLLWSRHCIEHSPMPLVTLFEYNRVVKPNGFLYIEVPQPDSLHIDTPNHYSLFSDRGWRSLFKRAHLTVTGYHINTIPRRFPNSFLPSGFLEWDDYYYSYWLKKTKDVI